MTCVRVVVVLEYSIPDGADPGETVAALMSALHQRAVAEPVGDIRPVVTHVAVADAADRIVGVIRG